MLYISLQTMPALTREPSSYQSAPTLHEGATRDLTNKIGCKDSIKFRFSEGNENKFSFLSVRKLIKSNEKPNFLIFFIPALLPSIIFELEKETCHRDKSPL